MVLDARVDFLFNMPDCKPHTTLGEKHGENIQPVARKVGSKNVLRVSGLRFVEGQSLKEIRSPGISLAAAESYGSGFSKLNS